MVRALYCSAVMHCLRRPCPEVTELRTLSWSLERGSGCAGARAPGMRSRHTTHSTPSPLLAVSARFEVEQVAGRHLEGPQVKTRSLAMEQCAVLGSPDATLGARWLKSWRKWRNRTPALVLRRSSDRTRSSGHLRPQDQAHSVTRCTRIECLKQFTPP